MIVININKAKAIAHEVRRTERAKEFEPLDKVIAAQIPGNDFVVAEETRADIREKYAQIQKAIDKATTLEEIKSALS